MKNRKQPSSHNQSHSPFPGQETPPPPHNQPQNQQANYMGYPNPNQGFSSPLQAQMMQMMQMMTAMQGGMIGAPPSAQPFTQRELMEEEDPGLDADIIRPHQLRSVVKTQQPLPLGNVLDYLCLTEDSRYSLGGIPKGCTMALVGPPGQGKTRTAIAALCKIALEGTRCAFVVAEEGFTDEADSGRDDLCSRLAKIGMKTLSLTEAKFQKKVARNIAVILSQYHKGGSWDSFVARYRFIVEKEGIRFVIIDSLNTLDPSKNRTADNLSALKTYNHEKGVTCITIGQVKDTGGPVGGEALIHTADAVFLIEEMGLTSKEMAQQWGGQYREKLPIIRAIKSVTTPIFPHPVRLAQDPQTGILALHPDQPPAYAPLPTQAEAESETEEHGQEEKDEGKDEGKEQPKESEKSVSKTKKSQKAGKSKGSKKKSS